ncbi:MAG: dihydropteroate synthase [Actinobacteria bacterium]|nr:dihydropteroate synthase [Actinomycetota bacterium]
MEHDHFVWRAGPQILDARRRTYVMGILNVTPDSFSDGGRFADPEVAVAEGLQMVMDGADILDVGGESTRPGSEAVDVAEERERVLPVIKRLVAEVGIPVSVDTRKHEVAGAAIEAGATIVNDVTAGADPHMFRIVAEAGAGMCLMHMRGDPKTMQKDTRYDDVVGDVKTYLAERIQAAMAEGVEWDRLAIDPGLGFGKSPDGNYTLMRRIGELLELRRPVLVGPSRKSFIGHVLGTEVDERMEGTAGAVAWMAGQGAHIVRVHDVKEMTRVVRVVDAIRFAPDNA